MKGLATVFVPVIPTKICFNPKYDTYIENIIPAIVSL
jgi:hypothetical protein